MKISCFRCGKEIDAPNESNADYITAKDTIVKEDTEVFIAYVHNQLTRDLDATMLERSWQSDEHGEKHLRLKYPDLVILDSQYDQEEVPNVVTAQKQFGEDLVKVLAEIREKDVQKTGIICPKCYKLTDFVIWGVHKKER